MTSELSALKQQAIASAVSISAKDEQISSLEAKMEAMEADRMTSTTEQVTATWIRCYGQL